MSENPQDNPQQNTESSSAGTENTEHMIPKSRFDEVNSKYQNLASEIEQLKAERQSQREQELAEQNRFKELYEETQRKLKEYESIQDVATRYEVALKETNLARIESIPEDKRSLVPDYDDPTQLATWLDKNIQLLVAPGRPPAPKLDGGAGLGGGSQVSTSKLTDQERALAAAAGISEEDYAKRKAARGQPLNLTQHGRSPT